MGRHRGLCAVGFGTNKKARTRAGRIALAATHRALMRLRDIGGADKAEDPSGDGAFPRLVQQARRIFNDRGAVPWPHGRAVAAGSQSPLAWYHGEPDIPPPVSADLGLSRATPNTATKESSLEGQVVEATATYKSEGEGYITLLPGDRLHILYGQKEQGAPQDSFNEYVYGKKVDNGSNDVCHQGWFPF